MTAETWHHDADDDGHQRGERQDDQRENAAVKRQHGQHQRQHDRVQQRLEQAAGEELPDRIGLLEVARQHAGGGGFEKEQRQGQEMLEYAGSQTGVDFGGDDRHEDLAHVGKQAVEQHQDEFVRIGDLDAVVDGDLGVGRDGLAIHHEGCLHSVDSLN